MIIAKIFKSLRAKQFVVGQIFVSVKHCFINIEAARGCRLSHVDKLEEGRKGSDGGNYYSLWRDHGAFEPQIALVSYDIHVIRIKST